MEPFVAFVASNHLLGIIWCPANAINLRLLFFLWDNLFLLRHSIMDLDLDLRVLRLGLSSVALGWLPGIVRGGRFHDWRLFVRSQWLALVAFGLSFLTSLVRVDLIQTFHSISLSILGSASVWRSPFLSYRVAHQFVVVHEILQEVIIYIPLKSHYSSLLFCLLVLPFISTKSLSSPLNFINL